MRNLKKLVGTVVSTAMDKTAVVQVQRLYVHNKYRKILRHKKKYFAHDEHEICGIGDKVQIKYMGQMSKKKHWTVIDMLRRQPQLGGEPFPMARLVNAPTAYPPLPQDAHREELGLDSVGRVRPVAPEDAGYAAATGISPEAAAAEVRFQAPEEAEEDVTMATEAEVAAGEVGASSQR